MEGTTQFRLSSDSVKEGTTQFMLSSTQALLTPLLTTQASAALAWPRWNVDEKHVDEAWRGNWRSTAEHGSHQPAAERAADALRAEDGAARSHRRAEQHSAEILQKFCTSTHVWR